MRCAVFALALAGCGGGDAHVTAPVSPQAATAAKTARPAAPENRVCTEVTLAGPPIGSTDAQAMDGAKIARVEIVGLRAVPHEPTCRRLATAAGQPFSREQIRADIGRLWATGTFDDIMVERRANGAGITILFSLRERPIVAEVRVEGKQPLEPGDVIPMTPPQAGGHFEPRRMREFAKSLREQFEEKGYRASKISFLAEPQPNNRVIVTYQVDPGPKSRIRALSFRGASRVPDARLRALMDTQGGTVNAVGGIFEADRFDRDLLVITAEYMDRGMLAARVHSDGPALSADGKDVTLIVDVEEGPVYKLRKIHFTGDLRQAEAKYAAIFGMKSGDLASRKAMQSGLQLVRAEQLRLGGSEEVTPSTELDPANAAMDLVVELGK